MKYRAIIFDMDGTIANTEEIWEKATLDIFKQHNILLSPTQKNDLIHKSIGLASIQYFQLLKNKLNYPDSLENLNAEFMTIVLKRYETYVKFIDGFLPFFNKLKKYNLKVGIATNACNTTLQATKKSLGLENMFGKHIYNISHVIKPKPDPDLYLYAAQQLGIDPKLCAAVEDSATGVQAAKSAGMFCIGINSSHDVTQVRDANFFVDHYDEIDLDRLLGI